jgi:hypothetical protein
VNSWTHSDVLDRRLGRRTVLRGAGLAAAAAGGAALVGRAPLASADKSTDNVVIQWNDAALAAVRAVIPGPTVTSRALAIVHTAMYDAWSVYEPKALPTRPNGIPKKGGNGLGSKIHSINYAAYRALLDLFPSQASAFTALMRDLGEDPANTTTNTNSPQGIGNVAARAVLDYRHADGANQLNGYADTSGYAPVNSWDRLIDPRRWQPLKVNGTVQRFTTPHWGGVAPFALSSGSQFRPAGPVMDVASAAFRAQVDRIIQLSAGLTDRTKTMADYWANGPRTEFPPGHWDLLSQYASAQYVSRRNRNDPNNDCLLFFALTNAIFDAGVACWDSKRAFDYVRPISAVRYLYADQQISCWGGVGRGTVTMPGSQWPPYQEASVVTPPFAEYPSGHSTFSAAGAYVLQKFTGSDTFGASFTATPGSSTIEPGLCPTTGITLSWPTYSAAAAEAGLSRQLGGIHFDQGDQDGRALGRLVAAQAWARAQSYINGTAR